MKHEPVKIRARFIGADQSLEYTSGLYYHLALLNINDTITVQRLNNKGTCMYSSINTFLDNWTNIKKLKNEQEKTNTKGKST